MKVVDSVLDLIGNTPMVKLMKVPEDGIAEVYMKCEHMNPSGSLKDRIVLEMIREAEAEGKLKPGYTIIEASTGNTGTAVGFIGTYLGYKVDIYMPEGMTPERARTSREIRAINNKKEDNDIVDLLLIWPKMVEYAILSEYETKVYLNLIGIGCSGARKFSITCNVPRMKV